jgi:hypothetical protein
VPIGADQSFQIAATTVSELVTKASRLCTACGTVDVTGLTGAVSSLTGTGVQDGTTGQSTDPAAGLEEGAGAPDVPIEESLLPTPTITIPNLPVTQPPTSSTSGDSKPKVKQLTDPVVGALLGDDEQEGVVPKLLDGLLTPKD